MNAERQTGPWLFSAVVSAGVHIGAVAVLIAALPPLEAPAAPIEFVLTSLEAPAQIEIEALAANTVVPAVAMASEPIAADAQTIAPDRLQATQIEAIAALVSHAPVLSATPAAGAIAAPVAIAGEAAITRPQEHAGRLEPASSVPLAVTTTAAAGGTKTSAIVPTASALAPMGTTATADAQAGSPQPAAGTALSTASAADPVVVTGALTATVTADMAAVASEAMATKPATAAVAETSAAISSASALAPMAATATAKAQAGSPQPIASAALPAANAAGTLTAPGTLAATVTADMAGVAATLSTAPAIAPVTGAQAEAPTPTAMLATPVPTAAAGVPAVVGTQSVQTVVGAQAAGNAGVAPTGAASVAVTAALSTSGATLTPLSPDIETVAGLDALDDYLAGYDGGDCFAVLPERPDQGAVALTAFAGSQAAAGAFVEAFSRDFGAILPVEARTVSQAQCGALSFVRSSALYPGFDLGLALDADAIAVGAPLSGEVLRMTGAWLTLLVIDDEGRVSNLDAYVRPEGGAIRFEAPVVPTGEAAGKTQLVLAVATAEQLDANPQDGDSAQAFLAALEAELRTRGLAAELAVGAFTVH